LQIQQPSFGTMERRVQEGGRRIIISTESSGDRFGNKRIRYGGNDEHSGMANNYRDNRDYSPPSYRPPPKRSLQSSVVMPTIETKSRAAIISELKKNETAEDSNRNRRLFSNLLVGTLRQFQKEEKSATIKVSSQFEKQKQVERRLEQTDKENKNRIQKEKDDLMNKRREKESEILSLRRKKAIQQYAEEKLQHFRRLQCFIQTQTKPPLFFLPSKHTLRTLELLKESSKKVEVLIELRREEMERELRRDITVSGDVDEEEEEGGRHSSPAGLKSSVIIKKQPSSIKDEEEEDESAESEHNEEEGEPEEPVIEPTETDQNEEGSLEKDATEDANEEEENGHTGEENE